MKKAADFIANLKISSKIWLCMIIIALCLSAFIGMFSSWYFLRLYKEDTYNQTADSLQIGSQSLSDAYGVMLSNVIDFASTSHFSRLVTDVHNNNRKNEVKNKAALQESMSYLSVSTPLLDSFAVIGKNGEYYSLYSNTFKKGDSPSDAFNWDLSSIAGITWLPVRQNPYMKNNAVVPVIIPIAQLTGTRYLNISSNPKETDVYLILLLDFKNLTGRLALSSSSYSDRTLYVAGPGGMPVSLPPDSRWYETASSSLVMDSIAESSRDPGFYFLYDNREYSLYTKPLEFCGLSLVGILPKASLYERITRMNVFLLLLTVVGLALAAFLSLLLSRFVTRPLDRLIKNVREIENDTYHTPCQMKYQDEIGRLNMAINSMYATIKEQFECLRQSERAKYRSKIQLLSEQINPHFLYNTLECINMEVLDNHKQTASSMITSLGDFLRIGLNYGDEIILLSKELVHVKAYIDIMNYRFSRKIVFSYEASPELLNVSILKSILQPLAENSILHGFEPAEEASELIPLPEIRILITFHDDDLVIEIIDNGRGIDTEKAEASLFSQPIEDGKRRHVGLNNIYQRLRAYYGTASITFDSIPYFQNTVRITVPYQS